MNVIPQPAKAVFIECIAAAFIFLFIYSATSKLVNLTTFRLVFEKQLLLKPYSAILAVSIPLFEMLIAALLFIPSTRRAGFLASLLLMSVFTLYIALMLVFASSLPCSCGGIIQSLTWKQHLVFNVGTTVIAGLCFLWLPPVKSTKNFIAINSISRKTV